MAVPGRDKVNDKDSVIHEMKTEIEKSEGFRDMLKKAKDRDFTCKVRPHIAAQSKGIASYKGLFSSPPAGSSRPGPEPQSRPRPAYRTYPPRRCAGGGAQGVP